MRVLLIEDDPMIGKSLKQALQNESMTVDWTRSGAEGEEALSTDDYAAVLLDLNLPDRNHRPPPRPVAHAAQPCRRRILATVSGPAVTSGTMAPCSSERPAPSSGPTSRRAAEASNTHLPGPA